MMSIQELEHILRQGDLVGEDSGGGAAFSAPALEVVDIGIAGTTDHAVNVVDAAVEAATPAWSFEMADCVGMWRCVQKDSKIFSRSHSGLHDSHASPLARHSGLRVRVV